MRGLVALLLITAATLLHAGPAPYGSAKLYFVDATNRSPQPSAADIRREPDVAIEITEPMIVRWFAALHWEKRRHDPEIAERAKPLIMVIDLYDRVQPQDGTHRFDTLYCSPRYAYSDSSDFIDISHRQLSLLGFKLLGDGTR